VNDDDASNAPLDPMGLGRRMCRFKSLARRPAWSTWTVSRRRAGWGLYVVSRLGGGVPRAVRSFLPTIRTRLSRAV